MSYQQRRTKLKVTRKFRGPRICIFNDAIGMENRRSTKE